jgi:hypothetical protein
MIKFQHQQHKITGYFFMSTTIKKKRSEEEPYFSFTLSLSWKFENPKIPTNLYCMHITINYLSSYINKKKFYYFRSFNRYYSLFLFYILRNELSNFLSLFFTFCRLQSSFISHFSISIWNISKKTHHHRKLIETSLRLNN